MSTCVGVSTEVRVRRRRSAERWWQHKEIYRFTSQVLCAHRCSAERRRYKKPTRTFGV